MDKRPECPTLAEGDRVLVFKGAWGGHSGEAIPSEVVKASRVWLTIEAIEDQYNRKWRMRRDTQDEGNKEYPQGNAWFVTPEQFEYDERLSAIDAVIRDAKVRLDDGWLGDDRMWTPERRIALADLIVSLGILADGEEAS